MTRKGWAQKCDEAKYVDCDEQTANCKEDSDRCSGWTRGFSENNLIASGLICAQSLALRPYRGVIGLSVRPGLSLGFNVTRSAVDWFLSGKSGAK